MVSVITPTIAVLAVIEVMVYMPVPMSVPMFVPMSVPMTMEPARCIHQVSRRNPISMPPVFNHRPSALVADHIKGHTGLECHFHEKPSAWASASV